MYKWVFALAGCVERGNDEQESRSFDPRGPDLSFSHGSALLARFPGEVVSLNPLLG